MMMSTYRCWLLDRPESAADVESDDAGTAPDKYVAAHCRCEICDVYFVEVTEPPKKERVLWRVECATGRPLITLMTVMVYEEEARREIETEGRTAV
jgi:hypothetical protein